MSSRPYTPGCAAEKLNSQFYQFRNKYLQFNMNRIIIITRYESYISCADLKNLIEIAVKGNSVKIRSSSLATVESLIHNPLRNWEGL